MEGYGSGLYGADGYGLDYPPGGYGSGLYGLGPYSGIPAGTSLLDRHVGLAAVVVTLAGVTVPTTGVGRILVHHGRNTPDRPPDPATCTVTVASDALAALPVLGDRVEVQLGPDAATLLDLSGAAWDAVRYRFAGHVTDVDARPQRGITGRSFVTVTAVSPRAKLGRTYVGDAPWPAELDGDRASRILALAAPTAGLTVGPVDPGTVTVLARDVDRQTALALLEQLGTDTGAVLAERRDTTLEWHDAEHRSPSTPPAVVLDASSILAPTSGTQSVAGLLNDLTVGYGGAGATVRSVATSSVATFGPYAASISTQLATEADAASFARTTVSRRSRPRWSTPAVTVDLIRTVTPTLAAQLLALEFGDLVSLTGMPSSGPFGTADLWVEGWTETLARTEWRLALDVSNYSLTTSPLRWSDVPAGLRWLDVNPALIWLDARDVAALT